MTDPTEQAMEFLDKRGLDIELAAKMGLDGVRSRDGAAWLRIPYVRDGQRINRKYRSLSGKQFRNDPDSEHDLWNVDCLKDPTLADHPVIITEGELDALAILQAGFAKVVSIPDGWTAKLENNDGQPKFTIFVRNEAAIRGAPYIIAAVDNDETGHSLLKAIANFFGGREVRYVVWPEGCKDGNDTLLLKGVEGLVRCLNGARRVDPPGGIVSGFSDLPPSPPRQIWKLGISELEQSVAFRSRSVSVLTGTPGSGKTTFAVWMMHHLVRKHDLRVGMALFETEAVEYRDQLCRLKTGVSYDMLAADKRKEFERELDRNYRIIHRVEDADDTTHGMVWLKNMIYTVAGRDGCNVILVDPWNELEHLPEPGESITAYTNFALMRMRQWAEKYDIHICVVAHPKKMEEGKIPLGYSISDSAAWANKPDMGWTIHQKKSEDGAPLVGLTTWKVRSRKSTGCKPRTIFMEFDESAMVYRVPMRA